MSDIKPALTPEQWASAPVEITFAFASAGFVVFEGEQLSTNPPPQIEINPETDRHGLAALALYGQPFGFTREDVAHLRGEASWLENENFVGGLLGKFEDRGYNTNRIKGLRSLADRIEALLPPEDTEG